MELEDLFNTVTNYQPPANAHWKGRKTNPGSGNQYWYQAVELFDANGPGKKRFEFNKPEIALLGYACDEGVRRNMGREGARLGPQEVRKQLAKLAFHHDGKNITDLGDLSCTDQDMEACQDSLASVISPLISKGVFPIVIGGGHDVAYGHFKGIVEAVKDTSKPDIGIINFDAHFDLRPVEKETHSGTPFAQILDQYKSYAEYFVIGIQEPSNSKELFDTARENNVKYILNYDCESRNIGAIISQLAPFIERNDWLYITLDMDGFSSAYAPGVSAPSPMGFTPFFVFEVLAYLFSSQKVISCDIAELNPEFDRDNMTAGLAARMVDFIVKQK
ncbi:formimidoylglutamase [Fulvivirga sp. M361]|uniref:formimidoylglutamase n=1 Tax=Fulvivirga sp. M361 TaxID=2594266 RepID=UPI00117A35B4|nr:formimidoylglutamase [Fulvivirga sp. M361]TRX54794.1 formimidoylglutamase [Fulvivirga sp. M361]